MAKLISIFGKEFFNGKDVLELGCGLGDIGEQFIRFGSNVMFCDGRQEFLLEIEKRLPGCDTRVLDQNNYWDLGIKFDFIIHTGVLYHLTNWKQDLICALNHSDLMFLETIVETSDDDSYEQHYTETDIYDSALSLSCTRPTAEYIEKFLTEQGVKFKRYDDADLNSCFHKYAWASRAEPYLAIDEGREFSYRRFWIVRKPN